MEVITSREEAINCVLSSDVHHVSWPSFLGLFVPSFLAFLRLVFLCFLGGLLGCCSFTSLGPNFLPVLVPFLSACWFVSMLFPLLAFFVGSSQQKPMKPGVRRNLENKQACTSFKTLSSLLSSLAPNSAAPHAAPLSETGSPTVMAIASAIAAASIGVPPNLRQKNDLATSLFHHWSTAQLAPPLASGAAVAQNDSQCHASSHKRLHGALLGWRPSLLKNKKGPIEKAVVLSLWLRSL